MHGLVIALLLVLVVGCREAGAPPSGTLPEPPSAPPVAVNPSTTGRGASDPSADAGAEAPLPALDGGPDPSADAVVALPPALDEEAVGTDAGAPQGRPSARPLGRFDRQSLPATKLGLVMALDEALRRRDPARLGALYLDDAFVFELCPQASAEERAELAAEAQSVRARAAESFEECLELVDLSSARYLALNYGSRTWSAGKAGCPAWQHHESTELYYGVGDDIFVVRVRGAVPHGGRHALGGSLHCGRKRGSAAEMARAIERFGQRCPGQPWPRMSQVRGPCPTLRQP